MRLTRSSAALAFGVAGLLASVLAAVTSAHDVRSIYSWPPARLAVGDPTRAWYTPLLLMRQRPESLSAQVPCTLPVALRDAHRPVVVLASTRSPARTAALRITERARTLTIRVGGQELARVPVGQAPRNRVGCAYQLRLTSAGWSLAGGLQSAQRSGELEAMPDVTGLFSELDLRSPTRPTIQITTYPHGVAATTVQKLSRMIATIFALLALLLIGVARPSRRLYGALTTLARRAVLAIRPPDVVVAIALLVWWVLSPVFPDDGWVFVRQSMYESAGGFSAYYSEYGALLPNGYWLEWLQHWLTRSTSALVTLRVPAVLTLATTWVLSRSTVTRILAPRTADGVVLWSLAAAFLLGAFAWGMTLRPEPATGLLAVGVLACMCQFVRTGSPAPVALSALLLPLAITGHHSGVVAFAPVIVAAPRLANWARTVPAVAVALSTASLALVVALLFLGTDLRHWRADVAATKDAGSTESWADELTRYTRLSEVLYGTPLRRGAVALIALTVLAYLLRRRRAEGRLFDLPGASLGVALLLLVTTPSKWPWHFGALIGIAAVAAALECARLRIEARSARGWALWPYVAVGATMLAAAWAWHERNPWNALDLRTRGWVAASESHLSVSTVATLLPGLLLVSLLLWEALRRRRDKYASVGWRAASWAAPILAVPLLLVTAAVLARDTAATSHWTLARQNIDGLRARPDCGLADDALSPVRGDHTTLVMPDIAMYLPCAKPPRLGDGIVAPPDHLVTSSLWNGLGYSSSPFTGIYDLYPVEPVSLGAPLASPHSPISVSVYKVASRIPGAKLAPPMMRTLVS